MSFVLPAALALLATALIVVLLALLRSRPRRREVSTFFVWRELRDSISSRTQRLRSLLDPLFLVQLAVLVAIVLAVAQPLWTSKRSGFASLALVVDASASMSTRTESGATRYETAVRRAGEILAAYSPSSVSVVLLSNNPRTLVANAADKDEANKALAASTPGWEGDARTTDLVRAVEAVGGPSAYEQIVLLTDHSPAETPFPLHTEVISGGNGVGITAFSVRENPDGAGVSAFAELHNGTDEPQALELEIADETRRTTLETFIEPGQDAAVVVPFSTSRGSQFVASIASRDASPYDDIRYASLNRSGGIRIRWVGGTNRYLKAALEAVAHVAWVEAPPIDLTVAYDADLDALPDGNLLLLHTNVRDVITIDESVTSGVVSGLVEDPLLDGLRADDIYAERLPFVEVLLPAEPLLSVGESPFLLKIIDPDRLIVILPSDLVATNLPITVDFPLLIRNLVNRVSAPQPASVSEWTPVGAPVALPSSGDSLEILDPDGRPIALLSEQRVFFPDRPGQYSLRVGDRVQAMSVNVDSGETSHLTHAGTPSAANIPLAPLSAQLRDTTSTLWPIAAGAGLVLLFVELELHRRSRNEARRPP